MRLLGERTDAVQDKRAETLTRGLQALDANLVAGLGQLTQGFGRLDADLVLGLERQIEASAASAAAAHAVVEQARVSGARLETLLTTIVERVQTVSSEVHAVRDELLKSAQAMDGNLVRSVEAVVSTLGRVDSDVAAAAQMVTRTIWEAQAATSAMLADLPSAVADVAPVGGNLGTTEEGAPLAQILKPHAPRDEVEHIDVASAAAAIDPSFARIAAAAGEAVTARLKGVDLTPLASNSPELDGIDWAPYIELSQVRIARVLKALSTHVAPGARVLDFGAYFGNFSLALRAAGYAVEAADDYGGAYAGAFAPFVAPMRAEGVIIHDLAEIGFELQGLPAQSFDAVLFMGAIEHVPHTPRGTLEAIDRVLKPGGALVLDTPNIAYIYTRRRVAAGLSPHPPIEHQFVAKPPFFGHHREYTAAEVRWMLEKIGHEVIEEDMYNYSMYGMGELRGEHLASWRLMREHPTLRELIFAVSRKPA